jgi:uncharacterized membrane protein
MTAALTSRPERQRGVAAIFAAGAMLTLVSALALAIDVGRLYVARRDLQKLADAAAIDAARVRSQCLGAAGIGEVEAEALASLKRNGADSDLRPPVVRLGRRVGGAGQDYQFVPTAPGLASDSVQVALSHPSPARILPLFRAKDGEPLKAQAAAIATWQGLAKMTPQGGSVDATFANQLLGGAFGGQLDLNASQYTATANASVKVSDLVSVAGTASAGRDLPPYDQPSTTPGLLSRLAEVLDSTGETAAATAVRATGQALDAGHAGVAVLPAQVLGLPPDALTSTYDSARVPVDVLVDNLAAVLAAGNPVDFNLNLPYPLGDLHGSAQVTPPPLPGSASAGSTETREHTEDSDSVSHRVVAVSFALNLVEPSTGTPIHLEPTLYASPRGVLPVAEVACARLGQPRHIATVETTPPLAGFSLSKPQRFDASSGDLLGALNRATPVALLKLPLLGQTVTINATIAPVMLGGQGGRQTLCFEGPPWGQPVQCNGSPATVGVLDSRDVASALSAPVISSLQVTAELPPNLPADLATQLQDRLNPILAGVTTLLARQLQALIEQTVPLLQSVALNLGAGQVSVVYVDVQQPAIYAR